MRFLKISTWPYRKKTGKLLKLYGEKLGLKYLFVFSKKKYLSKNNSVLHK